MKKLSVFFLAVFVMAQAPPSFKLKEVRVVAKNIEIISTPNGNYECIVVVPHGKNGKLLRNKGSMKVWFSNNISKFPVKIEHITKSGTMTMILKDIR